MTSLTALYAFRQSVKRCASVQVPPPLRLGFNPNDNHSRRWRTPGTGSRPALMCDGYFSFVKTLSPLARLIVIWPFAASNSKTTPGSILNLSSAVASSGTADCSAPA